MDLTKAAVLGAGSWGTALALTLADRGLDVILYGNEEAICEDVNANRRNSRYLPEIELPEGITASVQIGDLADREFILLVVPSQVARIVLQQLAAVGISEDAILVSCTKGIDPETGELMHELLDEFFPANPIAVLSGPSHAEEVARRMATSRS